MIVLAEEFREIFKGLVPDERVYVVENGVPDPGAWALRNAAGRSNQQPETILFMSTLTPAKGILELIRAVGLLRQTRPQVRLQVAGAWQDDGVKAAAAELLAREKLGEHVSFAGAVAGAEKAAFLAGGEIFCLPTRYPYEGQPLVILEAMAAGLPVLAARQGALGIHSAARPHRQAAARGRCA